MIPGPNQIIACPYCKGLAKYGTLISGNTIGARIWTDGKEIAPMLPLPPMVVKCFHCSEYYWLTDAEKLGDAEDENGRQINPEWVAVQDVEEPSEAEYYQALDKGLATDLQQQRTLRVLAWWRRNDAFRDAPSLPHGAVISMTYTCRKNLEALATLLNTENQDDVITKAELLRELGQFESARHTLSQVTPDTYVDIVHQLHSLCDIRDTCVRELQVRA